MNETNQIRHNFALQLYKQDESPLGRVGVEVDWEPALEWCHLLGIRKGKLPPMLNIGSHKIEPIWDAEIGKPYVSSFRTVISGNDGKENFSADFPITYFAGLALKASEGYVRTGRLQPGDRLRYRVTASPGQSWGWESKATIRGATPCASWCSTPSTARIASGRASELPRTLRSLSSSRYSRA